MLLEPKKNDFARQKHLMLKRKKKEMKVESLFVCIKKSREGEKGEDVGKFIQCQYPVSTAPLCFVVAMLVRLLSVGFRFHGIIARCFFERL